MGVACHLLLVDGNHLYYVGHAAQSVNAYCQTIFRSRMMDFMGFLATLSHSTLCVMTCSGPFRTHGYRAPCLSAQEMRLIISCLVVLSSRWRLMALSCHADVAPLF